MGDGGSFGSWALDEDGLDCFDLRIQPRPGLVLPAGGVEQCWHQVANAALTATAHAGGRTALYATSRGIVRMTGGHSGWGLAGLPTQVQAVRWGMGYARWEARAGDATIVRRVAVAPGDRPVLRVDVVIRGPDLGAAGDYEERWVPEVHPLVIGGLMSPPTPPPPCYGRGEGIVWRALFAASALSRASTEVVRTLLGARAVRRARFDARRRTLVFQPRRPVPAERVRGPAWYDRALPTLFVAALGDIDVRAEGDALRTPVQRGSATSLTFAIGLADRPDEIDDLVDSVARVDGRALSREWAGLLRVELDESSWGAATDSIAREARWHAVALVGSEQADAYFGRRYVSQGSAYGFVHGLQGAPRDYAISSVPLAFIDPPAAREQLEVIMRMTAPSGAVSYAHTGRGRCTSGGVHAAPTDLPLFTLWALTEYVWATGDQAFLDEEVPFYPAGRGVTATPRRRALLAFEYLRDRVGTGRHGMLRVGSGDWADPISAMVRDRRAFHSDGESGFNTAFAIYVLPRVAALIADSHPREASEMRELSDGLRGAMQASWTGEWFLRGWDGRGAPLGAEHLFLDGQVWALIARIGSDDDRARLVEAIATRCDDPSPIGATILDRPHGVRFGMLAPGWDCNGGVWAAINALLAWGYALHDVDRARRCVVSQSLGAHASAYPDVWYGIWSGPDAYNAHFGSRPGETFVQPATPMNEFPVMNSNAHAGPLLALLRVLGIETEPSGIVVRDRGSPEVGWRLETPLALLGSGGRVSWG